MKKVLQAKIVFTIGDAEQTEFFQVAINSSKHSDAKVDCEAATNAARAYFKREYPNFNVTSIVVNPTIMADNNPEESEVYSRRDLVNFGNYMIEQHRSKGTAEVWHANVENFKHAYNL
jgi:hypothetical protein